jgi:hypothetical protein
MTTTLQDIDGNLMTIRRGTSPTFVFNVVEHGTTNPKNLVGATEISLTIAARRQARARDLVLSLGTGITNGGANGVVTVVMTKQQTEALPTGNRWSELWITDLNGRRDLVGEGVCVVLDTTSHVITSP